MLWTATQQQQALQANAKAMEPYTHYLGYCASINCEPATYEAYEQLIDEPQLFY